MATSAATVTAAPESRLRGRDGCEEAVDGVGAECVAHESPLISPFASMSMVCAAGVAPSPGMVRMSPQIG